MSIMGSAWDNLIGGFQDTVNTVKDFQWSKPSNGVNLDYNLYMSLTLNTWRAADAQLIAALEKLLSQGKISKMQFNNIINRRNKLYKDAKLKPPSVSLKPVEKPLTAGEAAKTVVKDVTSAVKDVGKSAADTASKVAETTADTIAGFKTSYLVLCLMALLFVKVLKK